MRIAVGSDHRGFPLKTKVVELLESLGHQVTDEGTDSAQSVDYPDFASSVGQQVSSGQVDRGVLICGTGVGMAITANKYPGVRATACYDETIAEICRRHNDVNVLCLSADLMGGQSLDRIVEVWMSTEFEAGRHLRRLEKIRDIENGQVNGRA